MGLTRNEWAKLVFSLKNIYSQPYFLASKDVVNEWYEAVKDLSFDQLLSGVHAYTKAEKEIPTVAQLRAYATIGRQAEGFDEGQYWTEHNYWVLTDLDGFLISEIIAGNEFTADDVRQEFKAMGVPLDGTVLRVRPFRGYRPQYKFLYEQPEGEGKVAREDLEKIFGKVSV